ncbi:hypothetical protein IJI99_01785, partial [bacterium]|nr:hypothetical protein [bacterium]
MNKKSSLKFIKKRDGRKEIFYPEKITHAVQATLISEGVHDNNLPQQVTVTVVERLSDAYQRKT